MLIAKQNCSVRDQEKRECKMEVMDRRGSRAFREMKVEDIENQNEMEKMQRGGVSLRRMMMMMMMMMRAGDVPEWAMRRQL